MRITEIITEAENPAQPSRRGFLGMLGKGATAAAIAGSGLGGLMGGAKEAAAADMNAALNRLAYYIGTPYGYAFYAVRHNLMDQSAKIALDKIGDYVARYNIPVKNEAITRGTTMADMQMGDGSSFRRNHVATEASKYLSKLMQVISRTPQQYMSSMNDQEQDDNNRRAEISAQRTRESNRSGEELMALWFFEAGQLFVTMREYPPTDEMPQGTESIYNNFDSNVDFINSMTKKDPKLAKAWEDGIKEGRRNRRGRKEDWLNMHDDKMTELVNHQNFPK